MTGGNVERVVKALTSLAEAEAVAIDYNPASANGKPWEVHPIVSCDRRIGSYYHGRTLAEAFAEALACEARGIVNRDTESLSAMAVEV